MRRSPGARSWLHGLGSFALPTPKHNPNPRDDCHQVWTYIPVLLEGRQVLKAEAAALVGDPALAPFHATCAQQGCAVAALGPMGKVWEQGVIKVIQSPANLAPEAHPLHLLAPAGLQQHVGEVRGRPPGVPTAAARGCACTRSPAHRPANRPPAAPPGCLPAGV